MNARPRILVFTGDGKGKTTAALGMAVRAAGHGMRVCVIQFVKSAPTGELQSLAALKKIEILQTGRGFIPAPTTPEFAAHKTAAEQGLERARQAIASGGFDVVVLDEICLAVQRGLLEEDRVLEAVRAVKTNMVIVLTGRGASKNIIDFADTVTEMRCVKHGLQAGFPAQEGVEM